MSACLDKRRERRHETSPDSPKGGLALTRVRSCKSLPLRPFEVLPDDCSFGGRDFRIAPLDRCWEQPLYPINGSELRGDLIDENGGDAIGKHYAVDRGSSAAWRFVGREPVGDIRQESAAAKPILVSHYSKFACLFQVLHGVSRRAQLWVSYDGYGVCHRDYPRAVHVVHDAADMLTKHLKVDH